MRDIGDARIELEDLLAEPARTTAIQPAPAARRMMRRYTVLVGIPCLVASAFVGVVVSRNLRPGAPAAPVTRFAVSLSPNEIVHPVGGGNSVAISRDGTRVAVVGNRNGNTQIYLRSISELSAKPVPGTAGGVSPFFSPDGRGWPFVTRVVARSRRWPSLADRRSRSLPTIRAMAQVGSRATRLSSTETILVPFCVSAAGGTPQPVTELDSKKEDRNHYWPELLPGGEAVLFSTIRAGPDSFDDGRIEVQSLATRERRVLVEGGSYARYSPTGHVLYARGGTLFAVPFDLRQLAVTGPPVPVLEDLSMSVNTAMAHYSVSATGTLAYAPGPAVGGERTVLWVGRLGKAEPLPMPARMYLHPRISAMITAARTRISGRPPATSRPPMCE